MQNPKGAWKTRGQKQN